MEGVEGEGDSNSELSMTVVANILSLADEFVEGVASFEKDSVRFSEFKMQINSALRFYKDMNVKHVHQRKQGFITKYIHYECLGS